MNRVFRHTVVALLLVLGLAGTAFAQHSVTYWQDNKAAAVSLTFDDGYTSHLDLAVPLLDSFGIKGTFFVITDAVTQYGQWDDWRAVAAKGHEIGSHTLTHPYLTTLTSTQLDSELRQSKAAIDAQITSQKCVTFAYPYGDINGTVQTAAARYYLSARGITYYLNRSPYPFYNLNAWGDDPGRSTVNDFIAQTNQAVSDKAWLVFFLHTMDGRADEYGAWNSTMLRSYLTSLVTKNVWVATLGAVTKFVRERDSATLSVVSSSADQIVLNLRDTLDNTVYDQPLTIRSQVPGTWTTVTVQQGSRSGQVASVLESGTRVVYYYALPDGGSISLTSVAAATVAAVSLNPATVVGGYSSTGTVTLSAAAPTGGAVVALKSSSTSVATVPASVTVPSGSASATFTVSTPTRTTTATSTITATYNSTSQTATLTVTGPAALTGVSVNPTSVAGGSPSAGTVTLNSTAPTGGVVVTLTSSNTAAATVPASVTVPAGASAGLFTVTTLAVGSTATSTITATYRTTSRTATLTVTSSPSLAITTSALATGTVGIAYSQALAATGGTTPYTWSATGVPSGLSLSATGVLSGTPTASGSFTVTMTVTDAAAKTATASLSLAVGTAPPPPTSIAIDVTAYGDGDGAASADITTSTLTTTGPNELLVAFIGSADGSASNVSVSGLGLTWTKAVSKAGNGDTEIWWAYATGTVNGTVTATITLHCSRSLTVIAFKGTAFGADAIGATAGVARTGAPSASLVTTRANSWVFGVGNEYWGALNVTVGSNQTLVRQYLSTTTGDTYWVQRQNNLTPASGTTVTINATAPKGVGNLSLVEIRSAAEAPALSGVSVNPTSVVGGSSSTGTVTITGAAPVGGLAVALADDNAAVTVPASVTVAAGSASATFTVTTVAVAAATTATITATYGGASRTATLTATPVSSPVVTTASLSNGTIGVAYSQTLAASGGTTPYTWSATGVPSGLSLSAAGVLSGTPTAAGTSTLAITVADSGARTGSASLSLTVGTAPTLPTIDVMVSADGSGAGTSTITTPTLTTTGPNELLVAFIGSADGSASNVSVSGLGLSWTKAVGKAGNGDTEIWWAYATGAVNGTVTATITLNCSRSLTVVAFKGTAVGADAVGATASVARTGAPSASLVTTRANSWVFGVGNEYWGALNVTVGSSQTLVRQYLSTATGDTYWVQRRTSVTPAAGTTVTINATTPTGVGNLSLIEIRPGS